MHPNDPIPLIVVSVGLASSILLYLSALPVIRAMLRARSVLCYRPDAFVIGIVYSVCKFPYPILNFQIGPVISSAVSLVLYSGYLGIYFWLCRVSQNELQFKYTLRVTVWALVAAGVVMSTGPLLFLLLSHTAPGWTQSQGGFRTLVEIYFGVCSTVSVVLLMSSQLTSIRQVLREKNSRSISGWMLAGNIFCALCWSVYSVLIMNPYFLAANVVGDTACIVQLVFKIIYRKRSPVVSSKGEVATQEDEEGSDKISADV